MDVEALKRRIEELEKENERLRAGVFVPSAKVVHAPEQIEPLFEQAVDTIREHFAHVQIDPSRALIAAGDERYLLIRASALSIDFLDALVQLYADRGEQAALTISRGFLFDIAYTIGKSDAHAMSEKLGSTDPVQKLSHGPVHFAFTGWSLVDIKAASNPVASDDFCLVYDHPYSFEAASFVKAGRRSEGPVCIMNAGYSSGWCSDSFGLELTALEVSCRARGDASCSFVMAPPHRISERVLEHFGIDLAAVVKKGFDVPTYFERKRVEEELVRKERLASLGLLVSGVAHEVNTPLGVAVTAMSVLDEELRMLQKRFADNTLTRSATTRFFETVEQAAKMIRTNLERAGDQISNFRRVSIDHVHQEQRAIDVGVYVQQTVDSLKPVVRRGALAVTVSTDGDLEVTTYPGALAQLVTNFVTNTALHAKGTPERPVAVRIHVARTNADTVTLRYEDDGPGMTDEVRARAFQPFFTTARGGGGTGLGLHIVQSLVSDVLRGKLTLTTAPGKGVRFDVEIPVSSGTPSVRPSRI
jgi:two-component system, cell cycle sensor histidine kinase and response regulator CckA